MIERLGRGLVFVAGSVVGGLALAFVIIALRPDLIRRSAPGPQPPSSAVVRPVVQEEPGETATATSTPGSAPATVPTRITYSDAVQRALPAVVNISTSRLVREVTP